MAPLIIAAVVAGCKAVEFLCEQVKTNESLSARSKELAGGVEKVAAVAGLVADIGSGTGLVRALAQAGGTEAVKGLASHMNKTSSDKEEVKAAQSHLAESAPSHRNN